MFVKYLISGFDEIPIAMKYDMRIGRCIVGGHPRHIAVMDSIVTDYFGRKGVPRKKFPARNKVRMEFDIANKKFFDGVERMKSCGIVVSEVKRHGRLMR